MIIDFYYDFRPVGQGLFSVGRLSRVKDDGKADLFTWVHDCGSATLKTAAMTKEIEALRQGIARPPLDLLILSHFDEDHISGLIILLGSFRVRRLVLPYFTPAERVLILLSQGSDNAALTRFLAAPSAFIRSYQGGQETEILFVRKSEGPSPESTPPGNVSDNPVDTGRANRVTELDAGNDPDLAQAAKSNGVLMKDGSIPFTVWGHWEFCFYNLPQTSKKLEKLWSQVQEDFGLFFTQVRDGENPESTIRKMKATYRKVFGVSAAGRNDISLVTYTGPVLSKLTKTGIVEAPLSKLYPSAESQRPPFFQRSLSHWFAMQVFFAAEFLIKYDGSNSSLLYTGDISLNGARVDDIKKLLTPARWSAIEILQVPHHGAASSWTAGLAARFSHRYSVFSSARYHPTYLHPREDVLTDLEGTKCVLANEYTGAVFHGAAYWESSAKQNSITT